MALSPGPAKKLTIFIDDGDKYQGEFVHEVLLKLFMDHRIAGVTLFRGLAGYGSDRVFHSPRILRLTENLPLKLEVLETADKLDAILPEICKIVQKGIVAVSDITIMHCQA